MVVFLRTGRPSDRPCFHAISWRRWNPATRRRRHPFLWNNIAKWVIQTTPMARNASRRSWLAPSTVECSVRWSDVGIHGFLWSEVVWMLCWETVLSLFLSHKEYGTCVVHLTLKVHYRSWRQLFKRETCGDNEKLVGIAPFKKNQETIIGYK